MRRITIAEYSNPNTIDQMMAEGTDTGMIAMELADGWVELPTKMMILNVLLFEPMLAFKLMPTKADMTYVKGISNALINDRQTYFYRKILKIVKKDNMTVLEQIWLNVNRISNFVIRNCGKYQQSVDIISLCELVEREPKVKALADIVFDDTLGTEVAEERFNAASAELIKLLKTRGALDNNPLLNFMEPGCLKSVQIPQVLLAYGPRSELDDTMAPHSISRSSLQGLRTAADYCTEYLGAKKAMYNNRSMIERTQYYSRKIDRKSVV